MAVTNQQIIDYLLANPNLSDAQIVAAMEQNGISPSQMANAVGIPEGQIVARVAATVPQGMSVTLGDTRIAPQYQVIGSGMDQQIGGVENVYVEKVPTSDVNYKSPVGTPIQVYSPEGEFVNTIKTKKDQSFFGGLVDAFQDPVVLAALGGAAYGGLLGGGSLAGTAGGTAFDVANAGIAGGTSAFTPAQLAAIEAGQSAYTGAGLLTGAQGVPLNELLPGASELATATNVADVVTPASATPTGASLAELSGAGAPASVAPTGLLSTALPAAGTIGGALTSGAASALGGAAASSLLGNAVTGGLGLAGGLLQSETSKEAAQKAASDITKATQTAQEAAQFRPVGMTTRFGTSNFTYDPVTGRMTSAGYQLSPEAKSQQNRLEALANRGLTQAEQAQQQFAPLQQGATNLFNLGNQYISQSPEQVAQDYINKQMALLQPSREMELANLQNRLQQQGRAGLSVAQGGTLGATTPELQALYNARAQQELQLAANAQQAGQQNTLFGAGLLGQGAGAMGQYYSGQQAAYAPYTTALGQVQNLESFGQQPFAMSTGLGQLAATAGANVGKLGLTGQQLSSAYSTGANATYNPYAGILTAAGNPNSMFGQVAAGAFAPGGVVDRYLYPSGNPLQTGALADPGLWT